MQLLAKTTELTVYPLREVWNMPVTLAESLLVFINIPGIYDTHEGDPYSAWYKERSVEEKSQIRRTTSAY